MVDAEAEKAGIYDGILLGSTIEPIVGENGVWAVSTQEADGDYFVSVHQSELDALRAAVLDRGEVKFLSWGDPWQI